MEGIPYKAFIGDRDFRDIEPNGIENIKLDNIFNRVDFTVPLKPVSIIPDLRLKKGARVIDAALVIPNINDRYTGKSPDCGAYEFGLAVPHYGPRLRK